MTKKKLILVSGVSGVGKTTLCSAFCKAHPQIAHLEAGRIASNSQKTLIQEDIAIIQEDIAKSILWELNARPECAALVDGHLIIRGREVPTSAIRALSPAAIIIITDDPSSIAQRRAADQKRLREVESVSKIAYDQEREIMYAKKVANILNIGYDSVKANKIFLFNKLAEQEFFL